jgi:Mor family transcriptional regulator
MQKEILHQAATRYPSALPEPFDTIMEQYGFDAVCNILDVLSGVSTYIPQKHTIFKRCLEKEVTSEFYSGSGYKTLARKYGFSERHIRRIIRGK